MKTKKVVKNGKRGKHEWTPSFVIDELDDIMREEKINKRSEAKKELVKYCRVGRELKRIIRLDFTKSTRRPPL